MNPSEIQIRNPSLKDRGILLLSSNKTKVKPQTKNFQRSLDNTLTSAEQRLIIPSLWIRQFYAGC